MFKRFLLLVNVGSKISKLSGFVRVLVSELMARNDVVITRALSKMYEVIF